MIGIIFPSDFSNNKKVDPSYELEFNTFKENGYNVYITDIDNFDDKKIIPELRNDDELIYRGWMLSEENYKNLYRKLNNQLKVSPKDYLYSHHLPNWYNEIKNLTIESYITDEVNAVKIFKETNENKLFIKDYVKSLKTGKGSIVDSPEDVSRAILDMKKYKGYIEGGIILRKVIDFKFETEKRFFVLNGNIFSNSEDEDMKKLVSEVSDNHSAFFYSVDIIKDKNEKLHIIEIGDGQVSDMVGWDVKNFVNIFNTLNKKNKLKL